jgi:hypothetical protein
VGLTSIRRCYVTACWQQLQVSGCSRPNSLRRETLESAIIINRLLPSTPKARPPRSITSCTIPTYPFLFSNISSFSLHNSAILQPQIPRSIAPLAPRPLGSWHLPFPSSEPSYHTHDTSARLRSAHPTPLRCYLQPAVLYKLCYYRPGLCDGNLKGSSHVQAQFPIGTGRFHFPVSAVFLAPVVLCAAGLWDKLTANKRASSMGELT